MAKADVPGAKRAGLRVDLERLAAEGDGWLTPEDRYALKTRGACMQAQPGVFMVRVRTGGTISSAAARGLADLAAAQGRGWVHLTTRQQAEIHHVAARRVPAVLAAVDDLGLTTNSTCGHTMRGVMFCPDAGVGLDEPFDCSPDARAVGAAILARAAELNCRLPNRINIAFGGCPRCRDHARVNDAGFVSTVTPDGEAGYELYAGGSLGNDPFLAVTLDPFVPRADAVAAAEALVEVYAEHGDLDRPHHGRMKFVVRRLGEAPFRRLFRAAFAAARRRPHPPPPPVAVPAAAAVREVLAHAPAGGWSSGVRPQRVAGRALVTVRVPLGDLDTGELRVLADLADTAADGRLYLTRNQNVVLRDVAVERVAELRRRLADVRLGVEGADQSPDLRPCTGGPVCSLAISPSQRLAARLGDLPALARHADLRVHISGCPNSCAQHQAADVGFSGSWVTVGGRKRLGYHVWLGGDLRAGQLATNIGRVAEEDAAALLEAVVGVFEALRAPGERMAETVARVGPDAFAGEVSAAGRARWEVGAEPAEPPRPAGAQLAGAAR